MPGTARRPYRGESRRSRCGDASAACPSVEGAAWARGCGSRRRWWCPHGGSCCEAWPAADNRDIRWLAIMMANGTSAPSGDDGGALSPSYGMELYQRFNGLPGSCRLLNGPWPGNSSINWGRPGRRSPTAPWSRPPRPVHRAGQEHVRRRDRRRGLHLRSRPSGRAHSVRVASSRRRRRPSRWSPGSGSCTDWSTTRSEARHAAVPTRARCRGPGGSPRKPFTLPGKPG
jgi:hypothetical protein